MRAFCYEQKNRTPCVIAFAFMGQNMTDLETSLQDFLDTLAIERLKSQECYFSGCAEELKADLLAGYTDEKFASAWLDRIHDQSHLTLPDFGSVVTAVGRLRDRVGRQV